MAVHLGPKLIYGKGHDDHGRHVCHGKHQLGRKCVCIYCPRSWTLDEVPADGRAVHPRRMAKAVQQHVAKSRSRAFTAGRGWGKTHAAKGGCVNCCFDGPGAPCGAGFLNERGQGLQCSNCGHQEPCHPEEEAQARSEPEHSTTEVEA